MHRHTHTEESWLGLFINGFGLLVLQCYLNSKSTKELKELKNKTVLNLK